MGEIFNPLKNRGSNRRVGGHDFLGTFYYDQNGREVRPVLSEDFLKAGRFFSALDKSQKLADSLSSLANSWDTIPQPQDIKSGDLILYKLQNGKIPNIHDRLNTTTSFYEVVAFPDIVESVNSTNGKIISINTSELRFTSHRSPLETLTAMGGGKSFENAINKMLNMGYLKKEHIIIPTSDFRLFEDVKQFLIQNSNISLGLSSQEHEIFFTSKP